MDYEMDRRQVKLCEGSLRISTSGRLHQTRIDSPVDKKCLELESQRKIDYLFSMPRRKNSTKNFEPYVPPHRRIQAMADQNGVVESKPRTSKPTAPTTLYSDSEYRNNRENGYNYTNSKLDYSVSSYRNRNFFERKNSNQSIESNSRESYHAIDNFLDFKKSFKHTNGTNQVEDNTDVSNQIAERVLKLVDTHVNTGLKEILDGLYEQTYGETLPSELLNKWKFNVTLKNAPQSSIPNRKFSDSAKQVELPTTKPVPVSLDLNKLEKEFWVNIHMCRNTSELWGIIMDPNHLGKVEKLSNQMQSFYEPLKTPNNAIINNSYYALFDGSWHRVQCLQCNDSNATVLFIDRGDEDIVSVNKLHRLSSQFCTLPAQAIRMSLIGLEVFADFDELQDILIHNLFEKSLFAEVDKVNEDFLTVQLYFNNDNDKTVNLNDMIVDQMLEKLLDPKLHIQSDKIVPVHISHLDNKIYVQLDIPSLKYVNLLIEKAVKEYISNKDCQRQIVVRHETNTIYFVKSNNDQNWYRGKIIKFINKDEILVFLIDKGSITATNRENILYLEKVCSILAKYPAQAIEVQLDQIPILNSKMFTSLQNVISRNKNLYVKFVVSADNNNNNLPTVQLMKKNQSDFMMSINDALLILDEETPSKKSDGGVLAQPTLSADKWNTKSTSASSLLSTKSSVNSKIESRLKIDKFSDKDFDTSSILSTKSSQNSIIEPRLSTNKFSNKDFDASSILSTKSSQNSKIEPRLSTDKFSYKDFGTLSILSSKSSQNSMIEAQPRLSINKSSNQDFRTSSADSTKSPQSSMIETQPRLLVDKFNRKDLSTSAIYFSKPSSNSIMESEIGKKDPLEINMKNIRELPPNTQDDGKYLTMQLSSILAAPKLPEDDFFDVQVVLASDPSHFVIQLLHTKALRFNKMISKMSETCRSYKGPTLNFESIKVGQLYACKSSEKNDRDWSRVYVTEIRDKKMASVYCVDYGSYKYVDISNMVPLENEFYRLPYQAIWAELSGVKPTAKEWTVRACLKFQELTQSKKFVSQVVSKKDARSKTLQKPTKIPVTVEIIYCIDLVDTSSNEEDVHIADLLIDGGVAEKC